MIYIVLYYIRYKHSKIYSGSVAGVLEVIHNYYAIFLKPPNTCDQFPHMYKRITVFQALCYYEISTVEKKKKQA